MHTPVCDTLDIGFPIFAFSHCADVVAAVTSRGGIGVLGAAAFSAVELDDVLTRLDRDTGGRRYGIDLVFPVKYLGDDPVELAKRIPDEHREFVATLEQRFGIPPRIGVDTDSAIRGHERAQEQWAVAMKHNVSLLASALGPAPRHIQEEAHERGIVTTGLVGTPQHAARQLEHGTDIIVAQGTEAGGHAGEISTFVLVPQVVDAVAPQPVLAAGGVGDGRQIAAALALGAQGVWTGSIWLTTIESDTHPLVKKKLLEASSKDTLRSKCRTGKTVRQLRTAWVDAWEAPDAPKPLAAPLQQMLVRNATLSAVEHDVADALGTPVGQLVGMLHTEKSARTVFDDLVGQYIDTVERLDHLETATP